MLKQILKIVGYIPKSRREILLFGMYWYVTNNRVEATTTNISATANGFILQIATADQGPQHGGKQTSFNINVKLAGISAE